METITHATKILKFCNFHQSTFCAVKNFFEKLPKKICNPSLLAEFYYYLHKTKHQRTELKMKLNNNQLKVVLSLK